MVNVTIRGTVLIALTIFAASIAGSQQKDSQAATSSAEPPKLTVGSNLVIVPVIVTDKHGNHITGLKADDFEIKEEGKAQKIVRIDELTSEASEVERPANDSHSFTNMVEADHPKKLEIIALDQINTPFASARDGDRMLINFLAKNVDKNTLLALVAMESNGPRIIHDFTSDPSVLVAALNKMKTSFNSRDARTVNLPGDNSEADREALQLAAVLNGSDAANVSTPQRLAAISSAQRAQVDLSRQAQEGLVTLENFQQLAQYFWGVPGRKSLIWASTGFPFSMGANSQSTTRGTTNDDWQRTFRMLTDANIAVYAVDIGGLLPGANANTLQSINSTVIQTNSPEGGVSARTQQLQGVQSGLFEDPAVGRHQTMTTLADTTGGETFYNLNDGAELFRRAGEDASQYYLLAYYTKDAGKYGWRKLSVKVHRDGTKVRARSGFFFADPKKEAERDEPLKDLRIALASDLSFTALPLRGQWQQLEPAGNQKKAHFVLSIPPGVAAIDTEHQNHISLEFLVTATDKGGKDVANISQRFDTKLPAEGVEQIQAKGMDYSNALILAPGSYTVHFIVRDNIRSTLGSLVTHLNVD
jgi:VWFA-related protein